MLIATVRCKRTMAGETRAPAYQGVKRDTTYIAIFAGPTDR